MTTASMTIADHASHWHFQSARIHGPLLVTRRGARLGREGSVFRVQQARGQEAGGMRCEVCQERAVLQVEVRRYFFLRRPPGPAGGWSERGSLGRMNSDMRQCLPACGNIYLRPQTRGGNRSPVS